MLSERLSLRLVVLTLLLHVGCSLSAPPRPGPSADDPVQARPRPAVTVEALYPGANAQVVADVVAAPVEQQVNGVEGMLYLRSRCTSDGAYTLHVTFEHGVDLDAAQV